MRVFLEVRTLLQKRKQIYKQSGVRGERKETGEFNSFFKRYNQRKQNIVG